MNTFDVSISRRFRLESARWLPNLPPEHPCARMHGHSFSVEIVLRGPIDPQVGWLCDYETITAAWQPLHSLLDHHVLNEVPGLENPTSEILAHWIYHRLIDALPALMEVHIMETPDTRASYHRPTQD